MLNVVYFWIIRAMHISTTTNINKAVQVSTYFVNGIEYKRVCKKNRHPLHLISIVDDKNNDVYDDIVPFFGPERNVKDLKLTPGDMGYSRLKLITTTLSEYEFGRDEIILF